MKRRVRRSAWLLSRVLVVLALAAPLAGAAEDEQQQGIALIARAQSLETLLASDTGPFHLRAHVKLFGMVGGTSEGEYLLFAASSGRWFEQTRFPGFSELSGLYDGERWRKRSVVDKPFRLHEVVQLLSPAYHLELPADARIGKLAQKEIAGTKAPCFQASPTAALWQRDPAGRAAFSPVGISSDTHVTLCFECQQRPAPERDLSDRPAPVRVRGPGHARQQGVPQGAALLRGKGPRGRSDGRGARPGGGSGPGRFRPAGGRVQVAVLRQPGSAATAGEEAMERTHERILAYSRARHQFGTVYCLAEVGIDGHIHDFTFLGFTPGGPAAAVREAVKAWVYQPAACGGVPVPVTIYIAYTIPP